MVYLSNQEKNEIVCELRGIAQEIDVEFEQMLVQNSLNPHELRQVETHLNSILGLLVMYLKVIDSLET